MIALLLTQLLFLVEEHIHVAKALTNGTMSACRSAQRWRWA